MNHRQESGNDGIDQKASYCRVGAASHRPVLNRNPAGLKFWLAALRQAHQRIQPLLTVQRRRQSERIVLARVICRHGIPSRIISRVGCLVASIAE
jgi:hypothetical protein